MSALTANRSARTARPAKRRGGSGATRQAQAQAPRRRLGFNWLNRVLVLLAGGAVLVACLQGWLALQALPVQRIVVTGDLQHTRKEVVQELVQPALAGGFLSADLVQIRGQLEGLPWIYEASVRRRWPGSLEISVVEQLPIARWGHGGFLNHEGAVFQSRNAQAWGELPRLTGPQGSEREMMVRYLRLEELLAGVELEVQSLAMDARGQLEAELSGGLVLVLGGEDFLQRVRRFVAVFRADLAARADEVARVDLRYRSGLAVAFHQPARVAGLANK